MSERISTVIYYDSKVRDTENGVVFLSENTTRLVVNQNIDLTELRGRSLEPMVQTHLANGSSYLELYVQFSSPNEAFATSTSTAVREEYTTPTQHFVSGRQNTEASMFGGSMEYTTPTRHSIEFSPNG
ncbi:hypothetical protein PVK06_004694 [Gossypium arboreum]|uniref:Uncharacterized protein n=1 Tax=Gossypium arboreum TaxID=29729 RepID=A0ABR0QSP7_GOSAR|nr:hypothetical protein PVK06_004694 [Gossypium arboreum]